MKEITYTYEVIGKNDTNKTITVLYKSQGREDVTVTFDQPFVGDMDPDIIIQRHSPVVQWVNAERSRINVDVGTTGTITAHFPDFQ